LRLAAPDEGCAIRLRRQAAVEEVDYQAIRRSGTSPGPAMSGTARFSICALITRK